MSLRQFINTAAIIAIFALLPLSANASSDKDDSKRSQRPPPPEAITACEGKQVGDSVTFTGRRGEELKATCQEKNGQLAAVPEGGPR